MEFIPQIENTPVSGLVTCWVIDTVARELATWLRGHEGVHIAINVPPEVFGRGALEYAAAKARVLDLTSKVVLEITERGVPDKTGRAASKSGHQRGARMAVLPSSERRRLHGILSRTSVNTSRAAAISS